MKFETLLGLTLTDVRQDGRERIVFKTDSGKSYMLWHRQDCCEGVEIEDVAGDYSDLVGSPILQAEEVEGKANEVPAWAPRAGSESFTWTFYKLATIKGSVTIRWLGESNGYCSESVEFDETHGF